MADVVTRRTLMLGGASAAGLAVAGALAAPLVPDRVLRSVGLGPEPYVPDAPEGQIRLETVWSQARGRDVQLFSAVPAGYGEGAGLPVVVILHGASATPADYQDFGLGKFLTASVEAGSPPFVLAGADGGVLKWEPQPDGDDPQRMVLEEMPDWLAARGFAWTRRAVWGWSMGGYGALRLAQVQPGWAKATAAFSPAVMEGDSVFQDVGALEDQLLGIWCGTDDMFVDAVHQLVDLLPTPPAVSSFGPGAHTRLYWNDHTLDAFAFLAAQIA
jgi:enterochelin esterase-like enzyme